MTPQPPAGFVLCLFGAAVGALLAGLVLVRLFRSGLSLTRLHGFWADEGGSAVVEFPWAALILGQIVLFTEQLFYVACAFLVIDYAAFSSARSAAVVIAENTATAGAAANANRLAVDSGGELRKGTDRKGPAIRDAAVFPLIPVAGHYSNLGVNLADKLVELSNQVPGAPDSVTGIATSLGDTIASMWGRVDAIPGSRWAQRFVYAHLNTKVLLMRPSGAGLAVATAPSYTYAAGEPVTIVVEHKFQLRVPWGRWAFYEERGLDGWKTTLRARATMLTEGYEEAPVFPAAAFPRW